MKLKGVVFTSTSWDKPRNISALGGPQTAIWIGQVVRHTQRAEQARVVSLELDRQAKMVLMRLVYDGGPNDGKPFRRMTTNDNLRDFENCDVLGMFCDDRTLFYFDDDQPQGQPKGK